LLRERSLGGASIEAHPGDEKDLQQKGSRTITGFLPKVKTDEQVWDKF
jgi:hypothetical protein